jgi:hypothetical protein
MTGEEIGRNVTNGFSGSEFGLIQERDSGAAGQLGWSGLHV